MKFTCLSVYFDSKNVETKRDNTRVIQIYKKVGLINPKSLEFAVLMHVELKLAISSNFFIFKTLDTEQKTKTFRDIQCFRRKALFAKKFDRI